MADISSYLNAIAEAHYGEEVRSSIYNAIDLINKVGEGVLTVGTDVTSTSSSSVNYYSNSYYINSNTWDFWKCKGTGSGWEKIGNIKGKGIGSVTKTGTKSGTNNLVDIYTVTDETGGSVGTIEVTNASKIGAPGWVGAALSVTITYSDGTFKSEYIPEGSKIGVGAGVTSTNTSGTVDGVAYYNNDFYVNNQTWDIWRCNGDVKKASTGRSWTLIGNIKGGGLDHIQDNGYTDANELIHEYEMIRGDGESAGKFTVDTGSRTDVTKSLNVVTINNVKSNGTSTSLTVTDGSKIAFGSSDPISVTIYGTRYYNNDIYINNVTYDLFQLQNNIWLKQGNIKGIQGDKGDTGEKGDKGDKGETGAPGTNGTNGFSPTITSSKEGKVTTITITDVTGTNTVELRDGNDGSGIGDMVKATYDADDDGVVDQAKKLIDSSMDTYPTAGSNNPVKSGGLYSQIGDLTTLTTENKNNLVEAINEAASTGGASDDYVAKTGDTMTGPLIIYDQSDNDSTAAEDKYRLDLGYRKSGSAVGLGSMVMGREATSSGIHSIAEGNSCVATGNYSSARGSGTTASGNFSVADGNGTQATALGAHVSGLYNRATQEYQMVVGKYNNYNDDEYHNDALFEVGNGGGVTTRNNALQVMKNGDLRVAGDVYSGGMKMVTSHLWKVITQACSLKSGTGCGEVTINLSIPYFSNMYYYIQIVDREGNTPYVDIDMISYKSVTSTTSQLILYERRKEYPGTNIYMVDSATAISDNYTILLFGYYK